MKKLLLVIFCLSLAVCFIVKNNSVFTEMAVKSNISHHSKSTVVIDAGHGGKDCGTIGIDNTEEKGINLSIALTLYDYLKVCGIDSVLIRNGDYELYKPGEERNKSDLYNRLDFVNSVPDSMLISIHQNHFDDSREWGCQVWYSANNQQSKIVADKIMMSVKEFIQPDNKRENKVSNSSYYILYKATVPSVMVECGFMSNPEENKLLQDINYQKKIAYAILAGICGEV